MAGIPRNSLNYSLEAGGKNSIRTEEGSNNADVVIKLLNSTTGMDSNFDTGVNANELEESKTQRVSDNSLHTTSKNFRSDLPGIHTETVTSRRFKKLNNKEDIDSLRESLLSTNKRDRSFLKQEAQDHYYGSLIEVTGDT